MASWQKIARENLRAAREVVRIEGGERTACSRAYYAAFSALAAYLDATQAASGYRRNEVTPPHRQVRNLLALYGDPAWTQEIVSHFTLLYKFRIEADYRNDAVITKRTAEDMIKIARRVMERLGVS